MHYPLDLSFQSSACFLSHVIPWPFYVCIFSAVLFVAWVCYSLHGWPQWIKSGSGSTDVMLRVHWGTQNDNSLCTLLLAPTSLPFLFFWGPPTPLPSLIWRLHRATDSSSWHLVRKTCRSWITSSLWIRPHATWSLTQPSVINATFSLSVAGVWSQSPSHRADKQTRLTLTFKPIPLETLKTLWTVGGSRAPRENPHTRGENMKSPHRKAPVEPGAC